MKPTFKKVLPCVLILAAAMGVPAEDGSLGAKQPVFLLCPHHETYSAWSIFLNVDRADPSKILGLGVESLRGKNSRDTSYEDVLAVQQDSRFDREFLGGLNAAEFDKSEIRVSEHDALHVSLTPMENNAYRLNISLRVGQTDWFEVGGKNTSKDDIVLRYNADSKTWTPRANVLSDFRGNALTQSRDALISGLIFPVTGTGIYSVYGVLGDGEPVLLMDRTWKPDEE